MALLSDFCSSGFARSVAPVAAMALFSSALLFWLLPVFCGSCCCRSVALVAAVALFVAGFLL